MAAIQKRFIVPDSVYVGKYSEVSGWQTIENSSWIVSADGRGDPERIKNEMLNRASQIGANAIVDVRYRKERGSESSNNGKGTHYYTIHVFSGRAITIGKPSERGNYTFDSLQIIEERASHLKEYYNNEFKKSKKICLVVWIIACLFLWALLGETDIIKNMGGIFTTIVSWKMFISIGLVLILYFFFIPKNHGYWLRRLTR